jgi:hypothetical protein
MAQRLLLFTWKRPKNGHQWIDAPLVYGDQVAGKNSRVLIPKAENKKDVEYTYYEPLRTETGLFRLLADLPLDETAILKFADQYGFLAGHDMAFTPGKRYLLEGYQILGRKMPHRRVDTLALWTNNILSLKTCITLWEKARAKDRNSLRSVIAVIPQEDHIEWMSAIVKVSASGVLLPGSEYNANPLQMKFLARFRGKYVPLGEPGGIYLGSTSEMEPPSSFYVGQRVGFPVYADRTQRQNIAGFGVTYPAGSIDHTDSIALAQALVTTEITRNISHGLFPIIQQHPKMGWGELRFVPSCLIDALWLQFAEAVCGDKTYRECLVCKKPFEISPDVARTNRLLCSDSCKMRAYRKRKSRAGQLWDRGYTINRIVTSLGSDEAKVLKWVVQYMEARGESVTAMAEQLRIDALKVKKLLPNKKGG